MSRSGSSSVGRLFLLALLCLPFGRSVSYLDSLVAKRHVGTGTTGRSVEMVSPSLDSRALTPTELLTAYFCQTVTVAIPLPNFLCLGLNILPPLLTCDITSGLRVSLVDSAGVLTTDSLTRLDTLILANGTAAYTLTTPYNTLTGPTLGYTASTLLDYIARTQPALMTRPSSGCTWPQNSVPECGIGCPFTCKTGFIKCGTSCLDDTQFTCPSGVPTPKRRRALAQSNLDLACPAGKTACAVPNQGQGSLHFGTQVDCVDTMSDVESCGGCAFPLPGGRLGEDCTAIPNVNQVACIRGSCRIQSCAGGYTNSGSACLSPGQLADSILSLPVSPQGSPASIPQQQILNIDLTDQTHKPELQFRAGTGPEGFAKKSKREAANALLAKLQVSARDLRQGKTRGGKKRSGGFS